MVNNRVSANLLMIALILGGIYMTTKIQQEVFPAFEMDRVSVSVSYPGATPEEVEQGVVLALEEAVRTLDGVDEVRSIASEGNAHVEVELQTGADRQKVWQDVQQAVSRITTLPQETERPEVTLANHRRDVMDIQVHGPVDDLALYRAAQHIREGLLQQPGITHVELEGARPLEVHIEIAEANLRAYGLTLSEVAQKVRKMAIDRAGGRIETAGGEILLRLRERRQWAAEFSDLPIIAGKNGVILRLGDVANVTEGVADSTVIGTFNGEPSIGVSVYRAPGQTPIGIAEATRVAMPALLATLPPQVKATVQDDNSLVYKDRLNLLMKNGFIGLLLVLVLLSIFLEFKLAFWVTVGIPTSFLGALLFLPGMDVSINMVSMFAFIVALGIVVDDAIIAGENIYEYRQRGMGFVEASIRGAQDIAVPLSFAIITNVVAFMPLLFIPGSFGKIWAMIPLVVTTVFVISWVEALFILPTHLAHVKDKRRTRWGEKLHARQQRLSAGFSALVEQRYRPLLALAVRHRYITLAAAVGLLGIVLAIPATGHMPFVLMPKVESDRAVASVSLPVGSPQQSVISARDRLVAAANEVIAENGGNRLSTGVRALILQNNVIVHVYLRPPGERPISTGHFTRLWRQRVGTIPGTESGRFESDRGGPGGGASISIELNHSDIRMLERASADLATRFEQFSGVKDVDDGYTLGKRQMDFRLTKEAQTLGLTANLVGDQIRHAFYGAEAFRQLRGSDEVKVIARLPASERQRLYDIEQMLIRTPDGGYVPLSRIARFDQGRAFTSITRRDGRRTVTVTANVEPIDETSRVLAAVTGEILPQLLRDYPGLGYSFEGRQASMREAVQSFFVSVTLALAVIFALLAIPFRSYVQPLLVMVAVPFGAVGAILGHLLMGYSLSMISVMGIIALGGVVLNDALVMIDYANARRSEGVSAFEAVISAGVRRFRPIMLTTFTTFGGLAPMIFETSRQARFMIPMAISLGYGILFATAITLVLVPSLYVILEDIRRLFCRTEAAAPQVSNPPEAGFSESPDAVAETNS